MAFGSISIFNQDPFKSQCFGSIQLYVIDLKVYWWSSIISGIFNLHWRCRVHNTSRGYNYILCYLQDSESTLEVWSTFRCGGGIGFCTHFNFEFKIHSKLTLWENTIIFYPCEVHKWISVISRWSIHIGDAEYMQMQWKKQLPGPLQFLIQDPFKVNTSRGYNYIFFMQRYTNELVLFPA